MKEEWRNTNYSYIEISNFGNVRTKDCVRKFTFYDRHKKTKKITERLIKAHNMKIQFNNRGYCFVCFKENNKRKNLLVHRLVAEAFIPNPDNKLEVNHKDGNLKNNIITNLEWVTPSENRKHAYWVLGRDFFNHKKKGFRK